MATRKSAALQASAGTAVATVTPKNTNIVSIQDALRAQAQGIGARIAPGGGTKIRITQDKKFVLPDGTRTDGPLELVIVDWVTVHNFYEGAFDKDNITPPGCFAIGLDPRNMAPSQNSPNRQSNSCQGCPMNEFGSNGKAKACKNERLLAVLPPDADSDTPIWTLSVSPTALRGFDAYVQAVRRVFEMPPVSVITTVGFSEASSYPQLVFTDPRPNDNVEVAFSRQDEARELLMAEPDVSGYQGAAARKPVAKKAAFARR